jgi:hypothetical protein
MKFKWYYVVVILMVSVGIMLPNLKSIGANQDVLLPVDQFESIKLKSISNYNVRYELKNGTHLISPVSGKLSLACFAESASSLRIISDSGLTMFIYPIKLPSIYVKLNEEVGINQGDYLGDFNDDFTIDDTCNPQPDKGLNMLFRKTACPMTVDNVTYQCTDNNLNLKSNNKEIFVKPECDKLLETSFNLGDKGIAVTRLQRCLEQAGKFKHPGGITGFFGTYTKAILTNTPKSDPSKSNKCNTILADRYFVGQKGEAVYALQNCLIEMNFFNYEGGATGLFGDYTNQAHANFVNSSPDVCKVLKSGTYTYGENSMRVKRLQQCLREAGKFSFPSNTGFFGLITQQAFKNW